MPTAGQSAATHPGLRLAAVWYGLGVLMLIVVLVVSLIPMPSTGVNDKLSHLVIYFILAGWFGLLAGNRISLLWTLAGIIAYSGLIELLQSMTTYRQGEWADLLANSIGALAGICLAFTPLRRLLLFVDGGLARFFQR